MTAQGSRRACRSPAIRIGDDKRMPLRLGTRIAGQQRSEAGGTYGGAVMFS